MRRRSLLAGGAAVIGAAVLRPAGSCADTVAPVPPQPLNRRIILSGHSLTDPVRDPLVAMIRAAGGHVGTVALSTIPGSPLDWRWNNRTARPDALNDIADFDVLVTTERVSLSNTRPWHNSDDEALRWARHAWTHGAGGRGAEVLLYATWVSLDTGPAFAGTGSDPDAGLPWRERLGREYEGWQAIAAHVNANRPAHAPPMRIIPATSLMAAVHDAIASGATPGLNDIGELFIDDIHLSPLGAWLVALCHFAVIFARDPRELRLPPRLDPLLGEWLADLVWDVVTSDPLTGVVR